MIDTAITDQLKREQHAQELIRRRAEAAKGAVEAEAAAGNAGDEKSHTGLLYGATTSPPNPDGSIPAKAQAGASVSPTDDEGLSKPLSEILKNARKKAVNKALAKSGGGT